MDLSASKAIDEDLEKNTNGPEILTQPFGESFSIGVSADHVVDATRFSRFKAWNQKIENLAGLEARGIERVPPTERQEPSLAAYFQMSFIWFSANITANNLALAFLGPLVYDLGFTDSALCSVFGGFVGCLGSSYMATWGAVSGNRTLIVARYFMGYTPSKLCCILNIVIMVGYGMIDCLVGGQILSAVSGDGMSVIVGIVIVTLISWVVAVFGMAVFQHYYRWAWIPQTIVLFILVGSAGPKFDTSTTSVGDAATINANRLTFFSLCLSAPATWAGASSDFYVYYPENTPKWKSFVMTLSGLTLSFSFVYLLGVGLATGIANDQSWSVAYNTSSGALILAGYDGLGGFGKFCGVIVALGVVANNIPGTYAAALDVQVLGRYAAPIPRWILTTFIVAIYFVCAVAGRDHLFDIFENFLALMGYWVTIFITIVLEEHLIFRRGKSGLGFNWTVWADKSRLPVGIAALVAFLVGWAGAIISMDQVWYVGPLAKMVGASGADMGIWVGCGFAMLVYPPCRWVELKQFKR